VLQTLNGWLEAVHMPYSYGFAIILLTVLVKAATFPLSQKQVQSTVSLQALQPRVKELQAKYANDTQTLQLETARLYKQAGVNPLAGCLPTLATIPVFIGLYRALTLAAEDKLLDAPCFWIPSLSGPASLADQKAGIGLQWLFPFVDGHPPIGWATAGAYLVMPLLLVVSQFISQQVISPPTTNDPAQNQTQAILKFLPIMIGWFSLNVPAGLTLYWFTNNILSTAQQLYLKANTVVDIPNMPGTTSSQPYIAPKEEKVKRVAGKDTNARKRRPEEDVIDVEVEGATSGSSSQPQAPEAGSRKGSKFRARQAREAATRAAAAAAAGANGSGSGSVSNGNGSNVGAGSKSEEAKEKEGSTQ
jgi:YidC/Oxa1 family membrane protein insertase